MVFAHFLSDTDDRHRNVLDILDFKKRKKLRNRFLEKNGPLFVISQVTKEISK